MPSGDTGTYLIGTYPDLDAKPNQRVSKERFAFVDQYTAQPLLNAEGKVHDVADPFLKNGEIVR